MSQKTKQIIIIASVAALVTVTILILFFVEINARGAQLEQQILILTENNAKESASVRIKRLAQETEQERSILTKTFFANESESISFLSDMEQLARDIGLSLRTEELDKVGDVSIGGEQIKVTFVYTGSKSAVTRFSEMLEVIPYHSVVDSLTLRRQTGGSWEGRATINISINSL